MVDYILDIFRKKYSPCRGQNSRVCHKIQIQLFKLHHHHFALQKYPSDISYNESLPIKIIERILLLTGYQWISKFPFYFSFLQTVEPKRPKVLREFWSPLESCLLRKRKFGGEGKTEKCWCCLMKTTRHLMYEEPVLNSMFSEGV